MCAVLFLFCGGEAPHVLRGEGKSFNARRCAELCTNRNHHRPHKHRLGLFMVSRCMSLSIDSFNYFEWMCVKCFDYAHW
jgi:hypothetical protein